MPRFHIATLLHGLAAGTPVDLPEDIVRHLQVLRLSPGDALTLFDGTGGEYAARLDMLAKRQASVILGEHDAREAETPYAVTLAQGIAGGDKMDWLIEKAVELGVRRVVPLSTVRSVVRLSGERAQKRADHWRAIVRAASEQCGRNRLAEVDEPIAIDDWLAMHNGGFAAGNASAAVTSDASRNKVERAASGTAANATNARAAMIGTIADTAAQERLAPVPEDISSKASSTAPVRFMLSPRATQGFEALPASPPSGPIEILIGPEGGLSPAEETAAIAAGYQPVSLGHRILRTETAAIAMLSAFATRWNGW